MSPCTVALLEADGRDTAVLLYSAEKEEGAVLVWVFQISHLVVSADTVATEEEDARQREGVLG